MYLRSCLQRPPISRFFTPDKKTARQAATFVSAVLLTLPCLAQEQLRTSPESNPHAAQSQAEIRATAITIPAGTRIALVLTHPIQSRYVHRGDDIYALINSPVDSGNEVVIPIGTFVQGKVDKLEQRNGRGELHLQSMSITFPDGYVVPISGPMTLESNEGYAIKDPGKGRIVGAFAMPAAGVGLGALIGHSGSSAQTITFPAMPPSCGVPVPGCMGGSSPTLTDNSNRLKSTAIGAMVGGAIGGITSLALLLNAHHFYLDVGSPVEMTLQQPLLLQLDRVDEAVRESAENPASPEPAAPRPEPPPPDTPVNHGTCYTPGTPGTPPQVIPGTSGPDGIHGPPTVIPGTPPIPGTPYPCP